MKRRERACRILFWLFVLTAASLILTRLFGIQIYAVASGSMEPSYHVGDLIFVRKAQPEMIRKGDCITYLFREGTVTHRVKAIDRSRRLFFTKGDANMTRDAPVPFDRLVGKASSFSVPFLGHLVIWLKSLSPWEAVSLLGAAVIFSLIWNILLIRKLRRRRQRRETS